MHLLDQSPSGMRVRVWEIWNAWSTETNPRFRTDNAAVRIDSTSQACPCHIATNHARSTFHPGLIRL